ncbi:hypothetical protein [Bacillus taeanensis]|nr:hypothetical protein [Bacillus taeanensis]
MEYDHSVNGEYLIHVYDIVDNQTATRGWYVVNPKTGEMKDYLTP